MHLYYIYTARWKSLVIVSIPSHAVIVAWKVNIPFLTQALYSHVCRYQTDNLSNLLYVFVRVLSSHPYHLIYIYIILRTHHCNCLWCPIIYLPKLGKSSDRCWLSVGSGKRCCFPSTCVTFTVICELLASWSFTFCEHFYACLQVTCPSWVDVRSRKQVIHVNKVWCSWRRKCPPLSQTLIALPVG